MRLDWLAPRVRKQIREVGDSVKARGIAQDAFKALYQEHKDETNTLKQALKKRGVVLVSKHTEVAKNKQEPKYPINNIVDEIAAYQRNNSLDDFDILLIAVEDFDSDDINENWRESGYLYEGGTLYMWSYIFARIHASRWVASDYDLRVLLGVF